VKGEGKSAARFLAAWVSTAVLLVVSLPAPAQLFGGDEVARKQIVDQAKRQEEMRQQQEALAARVVGLEEAAKLAQTPIFELLSQIEQVRKELTGLRGQIEVLGNNIEGTAKRQRDMYVDLDTRLRRLEQGAPPAPVAPPAAAGAAGTTAAGTATAAPPAAASAEEARAYEAAQNQRRIGNYQGAIVAFQAFIAHYPKSPLAHRAQYWIGDSYYNLREFKTSILNQQKLIANYAESASVPDALLNIASSQLELGDIPAAKTTLDGVVTRYPTSEAAEKAKRRLANLR
jgi:tol-pal system protein YbgF